MLDPYPCLRYIHWTNNKWMINTRIYTYKICYCRLSACGVRQVDTHATTYFTERRPPRAGAYSGRLPLTAD